MPGENLTRLEAEERSSLLTVMSYDIALDLTRGGEVFRSETTVRFTAQAAASTFIDALTDTVHRITLNGTALDPNIVSDGTRIQLAHLATENELTVVADFRYTHTGEGLHRFVDPADGEIYLYTQFEVPDSRRVFAVFEQPDLKATFRFTVTAPGHWQVVSNSPTLVPPVSVISTAGTANTKNTANTTDTANTEDATNTTGTTSTTGVTNTTGTANTTGAKTWVFEPTPRISSYITALIAGPYHVERSELTSSDGRVIPLGVFCRASLAKHLDADYVFEKTRQGFAYYEEKFDVAYPFKKYDQLFVPEFNAGAMENAGAVTFTEFYVFRSRVTDAVRERRVVTILHELAHMWFGDLVTMRWWNDLWLNESFAEWASTIATAEATEWTHAWTTFNSMEKTWAYRQDQLPSTHPIVATINDLEDVLVNFDGITYAKGGSVLKQLVAWVGVEAFFQGVSAYFRTHAWQNTTLADLLVELEAASGRDLRTWSRVWLETAGVNTLRSEIQTDAAGLITSFRVRQSAPVDHPTLRPHRVAIGLYTLHGDGPSARVVRDHQIELDIDGSLTDVPDLIGMPRPDLILLNDGDLAYAKIRLDEPSHLFALTHLSRIEDPLARALVWGAVWDATRDAEIAATDYLALVLGNIAHETESTTLRVILGNAVLAASTYTAPERRASARRVLADGLWAHAQAAEPGSDAQFQFVLNFATIAEASSHVDELAALYSGDLHLTKLSIDADLGWELLIALVAAGQADDQDIDARLATDNTATGQQSAANARATIPTREAKERAWSSLIDADTASNTVVREVAEGFLRADAGLLEPFVERYFAALVAIWESRSYAIAEKLVDGLYPSPLANETLAAQSREWIAVHPTPPALRRLLVERLAGVDRALAAQRCDAARGAVD
ncbi:MAG: aminopeptidase N [Candidatus Lumbricidophila eiseniae]|uniref:Aminopeptidase N n=1 Tax=Candidatus Lumbricidiphila eiseniae TaxID=1969409 RepID=A0A2A6FQL1_9MICO|nr:MAG: aminopeptidase N [Candidatus Lumbricidophila eiseniae]